jgi:hypothetical protein
MQKQFFRYLFLSCALLCSSFGSTLKADPMFSAGGVDFNAHEFGLNIDGHTGFWHRRNVALTQVFLGLLRTISVSVEYSLSGNKTKVASATHALIAIIRMCEEICFIAGHPTEDHTIDIAWTIADATSAVKEIKALFNQEIPLTESPVDQDNLPSTESTTAKKILAKIGIGADTFIELFCSTVSAVPCNMNIDRQIIFTLRSILSFTRLLRSYLMTPEEDPGQRHLYAILIGLQACYSTFKLCCFDFEIPNGDHENSDYKNGDHFFNPPVTTWEEGNIIDEDTITFSPLEAKKRARINLGVPTAATQAEIKKAYVKLARELHPDKTGNLPAAEQKAAEEKLKIINQAYGILKQQN